MTIRDAANSSFKDGLLEIIPDPIIWARPLFAQSGVIEDFEIAYVNNAANEVLKHPKGRLLGLRILRDGVPSKENAQANFEDYLQIYQTGKEKEYSYFAPYAERQVETWRKVYEGGVLSILRDRMAQREAEQKEQEKTQLLHGVVDNAPFGIVVYEAVRNNEGEIIDFKPKLYNDILHQLTGITKEERGKLSLKDLTHALQTEQLFDKYHNLVATGAPFSIEYYHIRVKRWLQLSAVKLGDGFLTMLSDITEIKTSQQQLQEASQFLNSILDASFNSIYALEAVRDPAGKVQDFEFIQANQRYTDLIGLTPETIVGKSLRDLYPYITENGMFDFFREVVETGKAKRIEDYYAPALKRWQDVMAVKLGSNRLVITFQEITQLREAALQIQQQKNLLDNILQHSSSGISVGKMVRNEKGDIIDIKTIIANGASVKFLGISMEDYLTKTASEIDPNYIGSPFFQLCVQCMETGEPMITHYFVEPIGRWMEVSISRMDNDRQIYIFTDVTTIKEAQLTIERSEAKLQTIINRAQSGIFTCTPVLDEKGALIDFRFVLVNRALSNYVNKEPEGLIGALASTWFTGYKSNGLFERYRNTYETGNTIRFEFHYNADGFDVWLDLMCTKLDGELLVTFSDFTPIKKLQLQLESSIEELRLTNANLEEFAYAASHDLQEPLRKIQTFSDRLQEELAAQLTQSQQRTFERIASATRRMRQLIEDLLAYSRVKVKAENFTEADLNKIVSQVLQDLDTMMQESGAVVFKENLPTIKGDELLLRQMFLNLLSNAFKYRKPEVAPVVNIRCSMVNNDGSETAGSQGGIRGTYHLIEISDNGIGFEQEYAEKIFQVFQRLHGRAEYEGTGVGLAIVQKVVANHGGHITAHGVPGEGTTFRILLPV